MDVDNLEGILTDLLFYISGFSFRMIANIYA